MVLPQNIRSCIACVYMGAETSCGCEVEFRAIESPLNDSLVSQ
jgi:hypothetical protein